MKSNQKVGAVFGVLLLGASAAVAQPKLQPNVPEQEVFTFGKQQVATTILGRAFFSRETYLVESRIDTILLLTDEQKKAVRLVTEWTWMPIMQQELRRKQEERRNGVKPSQEERKEALFRLAVQLMKAVPELRRGYFNTLTDEQKATVTKIDAVVQAVVEEMKAAYADKIKAAANDPAELTKLSQQQAEQIKIQAAPKIRELLTDEQRAALVAIKG